MHSESCKETSQVSESVYLVRLPLGLCSASDATAAGQSTWNPASPCMTHVCSKATGLKALDLIAFGCWCGCRAALWEGSAAAAMAVAQGQLTLRTSHSAWRTFSRSGRHQSAAARAVTLCSQTTMKQADVCPSAQMCEAVHMGFRLCRSNSHVLRAHIPCLACWHTCRSGHKFAAFNSTGMSSPSPNAFPLCPAGRRLYNT